MSAPISDVTLQQGHRVTLVAHNHNQRPVCLNTVVTDITCVTIPHNGVCIIKIFELKHDINISVNIRRLDSEESTKTG